MRTRIRPNRPLNHVHGFVLSVLIYNLTTFGNCAYREQRNARNWNQSFGTQNEAGFYPNKISDFTPFVKWNTWQQTNGAKRLHPEVDMWRGPTYKTISIFSLILHSLFNHPPRHLLLLLAPPLPSHKSFHCKLVFSPFSLPLSPLESRIQALHANTHESR